jgi:hypothetical protein
MTATVAPNATRLARRLLGVRLPPASIASELRESRGSLQAISGEVPARTRAAPLVVVVVSAPHPAAARLFRLLALSPGPDFAGRRRERGPGRRPERGRRLPAELVRAPLVSEHAKALLAHAGKLPHAERLHSTEGSVRGRLLTVTRNLIVDRMRSASARHETVGADGPDVPLPDHADAVLTSVEATSMLRQLSRDHREVLVHTYLCGRTNCRTPFARPRPREW